jgi:hypothetical protein
VTAQIPQFYRLGNYSQHRLGFEGPGSVIPPLPEATTWIPAGPLLIGVELRSLGEETKQFSKLRFQGPSFHVCRKSTNTEHLRFDIFDGLPHYHYMFPGVYDCIVPYDYAACGPMWDWALTCLATRLPDMFRQAGIEDLCEEVAASEGEIRTVIPRIVELAEGSAPISHWTGSPTQ